MSVMEVVKKGKVGSKASSGVAAEKLRMSDAANTSVLDKSGTNRPSGARSFLSQQKVFDTSDFLRFLTLLFSDVFALLLATVVGSVLGVMLKTLYFPHLIYNSSPSLQLTLNVFVGASAVFMTMCWYKQHYQRYLPIYTEIQQVCKFAFFIWMGVAAVMFLSKQPFPRLWFSLFASLILVLVPLFRCIAKSIMMKKGFWFKPTYIVGIGENAALTGMTLESDRWMGHRVLGYVDPTGTAKRSHLIPRDKLVSLEEMIDAESKQKVNMVFAFDSIAEMHENSAQLNKTIASQESVTVSPPIRGLPIYGAEVLTVFKQDTILLRLNNNLKKRGSRIIKRVVDLVLTSVAIVLLLPLYLVLFVLVARDGGKSIYSQTRVGFGGKKFECWKFRTMAVDADEQLRTLLETSPEARAEWFRDYKLKNDPRVTSIGHFLRKSSLDELPQLFNVLRGEMSLVGPRPIVSEEVERYAEYFAYYCESVPGLTGLWQTSGRNDTSYRERVYLDVWYARNWSLWYDLVIIARTVPTILFNRGAY